MTKSKLIESNTTSCLYYILTCPHVGHVLSPEWYLLMMSFSCCWTSRQRKDSSYTTPRHSEQYQRRISLTELEPVRVRSITIPIVSANRCGEWGTRPGRRNMEPSSTGMSRKVGGVVDSSTILSTIRPRIW